jgi:TP901 family phage tail tape measure protein
MVSYVSIFRAVADFQGAVRASQGLGAALREVRRDAERASLAGLNVGSNFQRGARVASIVADRVGRSMTLGITVPVAAIGGVAIHTFATFERAIVSAGSKSHATSAQLEQMKKVAIDVGQRTRYSAVQAANAMDNLAAAGFNANDAMATLPAVTDAAQASNEDLALTANTVAQAMNAWGIPVSKAGHVADVFSAAANTTALTMHGLADAIGQAGEVGPRFNQSLEDVIATIGRLVDMGVPAASAGTAVRQALTSLSAPNSARAANLMKNLGIQTRDTFGRMLPLPKLLENTRRALDAGNPGLQKYRVLIGMNGEELKKWAKAHGTTTTQAVQLQHAIEGGTKSFSDYATRILFGVEGAKAFSLAMSDNHPLLIDVNKETSKMAQLLDGLTIKLGSRGAAQAFITAHTAAGQFSASSADAVTAISALEIASGGVSKSIGAMFQQTTAQKLDNLKSALETLSIILVQDVKPDIDKATDSLTGFVQTVSKLIEAHPDLTKFALGVIGITAAIGPLLFIAGQLITSVRVVAGVFGGVVGAFKTGRLWLGLYAEAAGNALTKTGSFGKGLVGAARFLSGPWGIAIGVGITVLGAWALSQKLAADHARDFFKTLQFVNGALDDNSRTLLANQLANDGSLAAAKQAGIAEKDFVAAILDGGDARANMIKQLEHIGQLHISYVGTGTGMVAVDDGVSRAAKKAADALRAQGAGYDAQKDAAAAAARATGANTTAQDTNAGATRGMSLAAWEAKNNLHDMGKVQDDLAKTARSLHEQIMAVYNGFTLLKGGSIDAAQAEVDYNESLNNARDSLKQNKYSFDQNTTAGNENKKTILDLITSLNSKVTADFKHAYSTSKAKTETGRLSDALKVAQHELAVGKQKMLESAGSSDVARSHVKDMQGQFLKTPKELKTDVKTPGIDTALTKQKKLLDQQAAFKTHIAHLDIQFRMAASKAAAQVFKSIPGSQASGLVGLRPGFKAGGPIGGPRINPHADNVQVNATPGEFMQPVESVDYYGVGGMEAIRQRKVPREWLQSLARGGTVHNTLEMPTDVLRPKRFPNLASIPGAALSYATDQAKKATDRPLSALLKQVNSQIFSGLINGPVVAKALAAVGEKYAVGMCLQFVRTLLGARGGEYDAAAGWRDTRLKHKGDKHPPAGAPVWWGGGHGHVALAVGQNKIVSTDLPTSGRVGLVPLMSPTTSWGKPYLGWSGDINGKVLQFGPSRTGSAADSSGPAQDVAHALLKIRGWNDQFDSLNYVISNESGWNVRARNKSSGAYGLGQALPASKMAPFGSDYLTSANTQLRWVLSYMASRYGDPNRAAAFWRAHRWYDTGGRMPAGGVAVNGTRLPETVLNPGDSATFDRLVGALSGGGNSILGRFLGAAPAGLAASVATSGGSQVTNFNIPIYYPRDTEVSTLAVQRQLVRASTRRVR